MLPPEWIHQPKWIKIANMFVCLYSSLDPFRFRPAGTDPAEISIPAVTYTYMENPNQGWFTLD